MRPIPVLSRDAALLTNNLLLVALAVSVLLGTVLPVLATAAGAGAVSVGAPYYDRLAIPVALALLVLMVLAPLARWDGQDPAGVARKAMLPAVVGSVAVALLGLTGAHGLGPVVAIGLAAAVTTVAVRRIFRLARLGGARRLARRRRAIAGDVVHLGVAVLAAGVAASSAWTVVGEATVAVGQSLSVPGAQVRLLGVDQKADGVRTTAQARVAVVRDGTPVSAERPALAYYIGRDTTVTLPAIASSWREDVYVTMLGAGQDGRSATLRLAVNPLVGWIWAGGGLMVFGAVLAAIPAGRRRRLAPQRGQEETHPDTGDLAVPPGRVAASEAVREAAP